MKQNQPKKFKHRPMNTNTDAMTPTVKLNSLAMKTGKQVHYMPLNPVPQRPFYGGYRGPRNQGMPPPNHGGMPQGPPPPQGPHPNQQQPPSPPQQPPPAQQQGQGQQGQSGPAQPPPTFHPPGPPQMPPPPLQPQQGTLKILFYLL